HQRRAQRLRLARTGTAKGAACEDDIGEQYAARWRSAVAAVQRAEPLAASRPRGTGGPVRSRSRKAFVLPRAAGRQGMGERGMTGLNWCCRTGLNQGYNPD